MSATTKRDVEHQVCTKTFKGPQIPTKSKHRAKNAESQDGTKKRAPVKSKGKHLCQSGKMQPGEELWWNPQEAGARSARERQERAKFWTNCKGWWPLKEVFIRKSDLRQIRSARKTLTIPISQVKRVKRETAPKSSECRRSQTESGEISQPRRTTACLLVGEREQLDQPRTWWNMWNVPPQPPQNYSASSQQFFSTMLWGLLDKWGTPRGVGENSL